jgi:hypothetical protein
MSLPLALVHNPPYPLIRGHEDPATKHIIDMYYLKKGILRAKVLFESPPRFVLALQQLRSWENPLVSALFVLCVISVWWRVSSPVWIPVCISLMFVAISATTSVVKRREGTTALKKTRSAATASSTTDSAQETKNSGTTEAVLEKMSAGEQLGVANRPIVWETQVGEDPDNMIAKMKMVHGLISSAAHPLNKWASRVERLSNACSGEDPAITVLLNVAVVAGGVGASVVVWGLNWLGWNNVVVLVVLLGMTPATMWSGVGGEGGVGGVVDVVPSEQVGWWQRLVWLYMRVPDSDETVHRRMAGKQVVRG